MAASTKDSDDPAPTFSRRFEFPYAIDTSQPVRRMVGRQTCVTRAERMLAQRRCLVRRAHAGTRLRRLSVSDLVGKYGESGGS
jgi:hypothetical protein